MPEYSQPAGCMSPAVGLHIKIQKCLGKTSPFFSLFEIGVLTRRRIAFLLKQVLSSFLGLGLAPFEAPPLPLPVINKTWPLMFIFTLVNVHFIKTL